MTKKISGGMQFSFSNEKPVTHDVSGYAALAYKTIGESLTKGGKVKSTYMNKPKFSPPRQPAKRD